VFAGILRKVNKQVQKQRLNWLGRQDSNLGMAESKNPLPYHLATPQCAPRRDRDLPVHRSGGLGRIDLSGRCARIPYRKPKTADGHLRIGG
jgi:hypothetical protein